ncbi:MAG: transcriptional regulator [Candidatus Hodarchaeales archaeon]
MENDNSENTDLKTILSVDASVHNPIRLSILMFLLPRGRATFTLIQRTLGGVTSGNLSSHIKKLQSNKLVEIRKVFIDLKPTTEVYLSSQGRKAIVSYAKHMSSVLHKMLKDESGTRDK